jgi:hypothetical protein
MKWFGPKREIAESVRTVGCNEVREGIKQAKLALIDEELELSEDELAIVIWDIKKLMNAAKKLLN